jgi:hypothetical protein
MEGALAAGNATQAQVYADAVSSILSACVAREQQLATEYFATNDQEVRAELGAYEELNERLRGLLRGLGGIPVTKEQQAQAEGETA